MTDQDAIDLAKRVCNVFRGCPAHSEWVDVFKYDLTDKHAALEAIRRLRYTEGSMSIDRFAAEYRAIVAVALPPVVRQDIGPRLTRERVREILLDNGAPARFINPKGNPL